jgi:hypothetical protein
MSSEIAAGAGIICRGLIKKSTHEEENNSHFIALRHCNGFRICRQGQHLSSPSAVKLLLSLQRVAIMLSESVTVSRAMTDHCLLIWEQIYWSVLMELIGMTSMAQPARDT